MPRKDPDVWDPPDDLPRVEEPPSEFLRHFADRAVRVGKDGSNAQLVRVHRPNNAQKKHTNMNSNSPLQRNNNNNNNNNNINSITPPRLRSQQTGGIVAPDEPKHTKQPIIPLQPAPLKYIKSLGSNSSTGLGPLPSNGSDIGGSMKSIVSLNGVKSVNNTLMHVQKKNESSVAATAVMMPPRLLPLDTLSSSSTQGGRKSPEVVSVERVEATGPVESFPSAHVPLDNLGVVVQTGKGLKLPLARLPPRKMNWHAEELMPKPHAIRRETPFKNTQQNNDDEFTHITDDRTGSRPSTMHSLDEESNNNNSTLLDDSPPIPLYQPTGLFFVEDPLKKKKGNVKKSAINPITNSTTTTTTTTTTNNNNNNNNNNKTTSIDGHLGNKPPSGGIKRPATDKGPIGRSDTAKSNLLIGKYKMNSAPPSGVIPLSLRLQPLQQERRKEMQYPPKPSTTSASSSSALTDNRDDDQEDVKKKPITYKTHNLKEYRVLMERVANLKRGGLGPADTDEQRQAREKMQRQRQYGELVEKQTANLLREKVQQRLQQQQQKEEGRDGSVETTSDAPVVNKQPPPPERIQAQERRARALEYARRIPKPETSVGQQQKQHEQRGENDSPTAVQSNPTKWRTPQEEAEWRREKRLMELEAKHHVDRERVAAVKRYLGHS
ncbi:Jhy protein [Trypanosoma melophagium]|uniref:Jhy protein n=1 Tax=Trypanosoma melophagium TaxID=715481 RepID=UPI00351A6278|nr:Jhy protein [Trypanosoma melophagium]